LSAPIKRSRLIDPPNMTPLSSIDQTIAYTKSLLKEAHTRSLRLSSFGSLAIRIQTEQCPFLCEDPQRTYKDVDLVSLSRYQDDLHYWLRGSGWQRWEEAFLITEGKRAVYKSDDRPFVIEIFFDELSFCHRLDLRDRIGNEDTIPLGDLLLTKLQRVESRPKDFDDMAALLACRSEEFSSPDKASTMRVVQILSSDWGFCHSALKNLAQLNVLASKKPPNLTLQGSQALGSTIQSLTSAIGQAPKSFAWRLRRLLGEQLPWYRSVEPLSEPF
jgi:hypothetical protein